MKTESIANIKKELKHLPNEELINICLRLGKFKKDNKALLTYLLFLADDEENYVQEIKNSIDEQFEMMNTNSYFYMKKTIRKILKQIKQYVKFSKIKATEIELLVYFCEKLNNLKPSIFENRMLTNLFDRQILLVLKKLDQLHEDLQYDFTIRLDEFIDIDLYRN
ncbi:hypothetical protein CW751_11650 [Brumimicrobium salinarum]|uniref:Uncharacterized protein n=1 Tax=Brumimicrobium salinarum TaxID=2058658 RepID=A0A2I0R173_9FLAO|nr:hypothetical protein [Brumimicrobium salinarum]PKR80150.1 hypothetical protein CW751_11650 [Brumimicrobium salinarum]